MIQFMTQIDIAVRGWSGSSMKGQPVSDSAKAETQKDHERVSCGLFWAVGKYKPTNCMIVSAIASDQALSRKF